MKVYQALAQVFHAEGCREIFALMGDANMYWLTAFDQLDDARIFYARHEAGAVAMADGYARASGRPGVCAVTCGPGLTQVGTSLVAAVRYSVPMVLFAGDSPRGAVTGVQYLDQPKFVDACGARSLSVLRASDAVDLARQAFDIARREQTAVVLNVPIDVQEEEVEPPKHQPAGGVTDREYVPDPDSLDQAAGMLAVALRPLIVVGRGALDSATLDAIDSLADRIGALVATTMLAKGCWDSRTYGVGIAGEFGLQHSSELCSEADVVLAVGASLNEFTTQEGRLFARARIIQIGDDPRRVGRASVAIDVGLVGDARRTVEQLEEILAGGAHTSIGFRTDEVRARLTAGTETTSVGDGFARPDEARLDPREVVEHLERWIPPDALVVQGAGHFWAFPIYGLSGGSSRRFIFTNGFGAVGQALPIAIGASVACPDRRVVAIEGDTSLMMNVQELDTAARYGVAVDIVVMDDDALGAELHKLDMRGIPSESACLVSPDFSAVAEALGATGALATTIEDLDKACTDRDSNPSGPWVLDVKISRLVRAIAGIRIPSYMGHGG